MRSPARGQRAAAGRPLYADLAAQRRAEDSPISLHGPGLYCGAAIVLGCLALYVRTAARDIVVGDTPELMTVAVTLGVAHPSGYPLLTLLGHLFSLLPFGPIPFRLSVMAAVCGAVTVGLTYLTAWRLSRSWPAAAVAAAALALNPLFWSWSIVFEAFPLNNAIAAVFIYLLVLWETRARDRYLVAAAFVSGLGLSNHQTIVLVGPATLFLLWRRRHRLLRRPKLIAECAVAMAVGILPYASIPWAAARHPYLSWNDVTSLSDFIALVTRADYGIGKLVAATEFAGGSPLPRLAALGTSVGVIEALLLCAGAVEAYRRIRWYFWFAILGFLFAGPAFASYANMNLSKDTTLWVLQRFFLLPHVIVAPLAAFGLVILVRLPTRAAGWLNAEWFEWAIALVMLAAVAASAAAKYRDIDQRNNHIAGRYARDVLDSLEPGSLLLASGDEHGSPVAFLQAVEGRRPDVVLVLTPLMKAEWYPRLLRARYPNLKIPSNKAAALLTLKDIVEANGQRPISVVGPLVDKSLEGNHGFIQHGLVALVKPLAQRFDLGTIAANNDTLLRRYEPPSPSSVHLDTFEPQILRSYASPAEWIGTQYKRVGLSAQAATWYRRALLIDPGYPEAQRGLAEVGH